MRCRAQCRQLAAAGALSSLPVDNGTDPALHCFKSAGAGAPVRAAELTLLTSLSGTASTAMGDDVFGP